LSLVTGVVATVPVAIAAVSHAFLFSCLPAVGATLGLIGISSLLKLFLFLNTKGKGIVAIGAGECFVLK
jgi:hypothetical protein